MTAIKDARAALAAINDNSNYGDGGIDNRVLTQVGEALESLIADRERVTARRFADGADFVELRRLAERVDTPAPWETRNDGPGEPWRVCHDREHVIYLGFDTVAEFTENDAEFIAAANPRTVLALLNVLDALSAERPDRDATDDEREALETVAAKAFKEWWDADDTRGVGQIIADAVLAAGFRRQGPITDARVTIRHVGGNTLTGTVQQVLSTHLATGWALDGAPVIECPHWAPGTITLRRGCTACAAEAGRSGS